MFVRWKKTRECNVRGLKRKSENKETDTTDIFHATILVLNEF